ncbi:transcriptional regulator Crp/Fnr family [Patulibacter medicamentivorans]|uniref:Transcriptional regulator Crp/Fnr family n=1 Tax=Patulibacter medicamentivorans TaxID=1097667 RepID=H0E3T8_9ACTN|nr:Crp/Fnr family transcriptional regulator [Patulibacter medicamentivorans]EHN11657.1 transcriptional regulator Crp/Fnr family [Patulibacter medicamentivorans]
MAGPTRTVDGASRGVGGTFLDALGEDAQRELRRRAVVRRFPRGNAIAHAGQVGDRVLVLVSGHVKLTRVTAEGRDVLLAVRGPGDLVGEQSAIDGDVRSASIVALDAVEALAIAPDDFLNYVTTVPDAALYVMRNLNDRLRDADRKRVEHAAHDVVGRLSARIVELCERFGDEAPDGTRIDLPLTQEDLAGWVGASREATSRGLHQMRELGWVTTARRSIVCHDLVALRRRAEG